MTSRQHQDWIDHGRPDSGLARPLAQLRDVLRAAGYLVYDFPNDAHLDDQPPQDHTYYSETGWPGTSPKWWRHAIDIMPSHGGADLYALGQRIVADRQAGQATWIKYINVPTDASLRGAMQHGWKPGHYQRTSSDTGHIHLSSITGVENLDAPYNPLADVATAEGGDMSVHTIDEVFNLLERALGGFTDDGQPTQNQLGHWIAEFQKDAGDDQARDVSLATKVDALGTLLTQVSGRIAAPPVVDVQALAAALVAAGVGQVDVPTLAAALEEHLPTHITLTGTVA